MGWWLERRVSFGGDLVGSVALPRVVVGVGGAEGGLALGDRRLELGWLVGVGVPSLPVDVDGLAGDHHRRSDIAEQREESGGVGCRVAGAIDHQVRPATEGVWEGCRFVPVGLEELRAQARQAGRDARRIPPRHHHLPTGNDQPAGGRPPDSPRSGQDHRPTHPEQPICRASGVG